MGESFSDLAITESIGIATIVVCLRSLRSFVTQSNFFV